MGYKNEIKIIAALSILLLFTLFVALIKVPDDPVVYSLQKEEAEVMDNAKPQELSQDL